jgi:diguanylate cyclase (GGDEF)-like protein
MVDIDFFKLFNDLHSYRIGDEVLRMLANRCQSTIRRVDILARYGGEEFVVLLVENNLDNGVNTAERLRKAISEVPFETSIGELRVTVSIGVTELSEQFQTLSDLIDNAGKAAHHAKQLGRNKVWASQTDAEFSV